ncbi:MAG: hypothetical protein HYS18_08515 [Burkholderiales bacterium]|nr:hypothetical protein [Burkholderiales bacterium]
MQLELDDQEQDTLEEVLKSFLSELRSEVGHTDRLEFREQLKGQEVLIKQILGKLDQAHSRHV